MRIPAPEYVLVEWPDYGRAAWTWIQYLTVDPTVLTGTRVALGSRLDAIRWIAAKRRGG